VSEVEDLLSAALARAERMRDRRIAEVLRRARLVARPGTSGAVWESSVGTIRAVEVTAMVDGFALGLCETFPSLRDAIVDAICAEAPRVIGASVADLAIEWGLRERRVEAGYRDELHARADADDDEHIRRALVAYLTAAGEREAALVLTGSELRVGMREAWVDVTLPDREAIERALSSLLRRPIRIGRLDPSR
jgi:hypothetical protein